MKKYLLREGKDELAELINSRIDLFIKLNRNTVFVNKTSQEISSIFKEMYFNIWDVFADKILDSVLPDYYDSDLDDPVIDTMDKVIIAELKENHTHLDLSDIKIKMDESKGSIKKKSRNNKTLEEKIEIYIQAYIKFYRKNAVYRKEFQINNHNDENKNEVDQSDNVEDFKDEQNHDKIYKSKGIIKKIYLSKPDSKEFNQKELTRYSVISAPTWSRTIGKSSKERTIFFSNVYKKLHDTIESKRFNDSTELYKDAYNELLIIVEPYTPS